MLKTNSKKVIEKVKVYILENFEEYYNDNSEYISEKLTNVKDVFNFIIKTIKEEKKHDVKRNYNFLSFEIFKDYCQGLPSILNCDFLYHPTAKKILVNWLEETEEEAARFTEEQAEEKIIYLLYKTLNKYSTF